MRLTDRELTIRSILIEMDQKFANHSILNEYDQELEIDAIQAFEIDSVGIEVILEMVIPLILKVVDQELRVLIEVNSNSLIPMNLVDFLLISASFVFSFLRPSSGSIFLYLF